MYKINCVKKSVECMLLGALFHSCEKEATERCFFVESLRVFNR